MCIFHPLQVNLVNSLILLIDCIIWFVLLLVLQKLQYIKIRINRQTYELSNVPFIFVRNLVSPRQVTPLRTQLFFIVKTAAHFKTNYILLVSVATDASVADDSQNLPAIQIRPYLVVIEQITKYHNLISFVTPLTII